MLVIYEDDGSVTQTIHIGDFDALRKIYQEQGRNVADADYIEDPEKIYVKDGGKVEIRPDIVITGAVVQVKANGVDTLHFTIEPAEYTVTVYLNGLVVHRESASTGALEFSTTEPGSYMLMFEAAFPYARTFLNLEAK